MSLIRQPAVAGAFYPADPKKLHEMMQHYLNESKTTEKVPKAIIVPHAGYIYSGPIATTAYARLQNSHDSITRVVLLGPSHRVGFQGLAVCSADTFATPLGNIPVDTESVQSIAQLPYVQYIDQAHLLEHSLEVHLPFLQEVLDSFSLVPIVVVGDATAEQVSEILELFWGGPETLIVISSDLSHYHDYATARQMDKATSKHCNTNNWTMNRPAAEYRSAISWRWREKNPCTLKPST